MSEVRQNGWSAPLGLEPSTIGAIYSPQMGVNFGDAIVGIEFPQMNNSCEKAFLRRHSHLTLTAAKRERSSRSKRNKKAVRIKFVGTWGVPTGKPRSFLFRTCHQPFPPSFLINQNAPPTFVRIPTSCKRGTPVRCNARPRPVPFPLSQRGHQIPSPQTIDNDR